MLNGANPSGTPWSLNEPARWVRLKRLLNTSILALWKSAAYRKVRSPTPAIASPLKMAPLTAAAGCAWVDGAGGGTAGLQPVIVPASESKMNSAGPLALPEWTTKPSVPLNTCPVGAPPAGKWATHQGNRGGGPVKAPGGIGA